MLRSKSFKSVSSLETIERLPRFPPEWLSHSYPHHSLSTCSSLVVVVPIFSNSIQHSIQELQSGIYMLRWMNPWSAGGKYKCKCNQQPRCGLIRMEGWMGVRLVWGGHNMAYTSLGEKLVNWKSSPNTGTYRLLSNKPPTPPATHWCWCSRYLVYITLWMTHRCNMSNPKSKAITWWKCALFLFFQGYWMVSVTHPYSESPSVLKEGPLTQSSWNVTGN